MRNHAVAEGVLLSPTTPKVKREIDLALPVDEAWELLVETGLLEGWLAPDVDLVPEAGSPLRVRDDDGTERVGVVEEVVQAERLTFSWWPLADPERESRVDLVLVGIPTGTRLVVTETLAAGAIGASPWAARLQACARLAGAALRA
jgi:uncharacterized protein YndB with AHSA1/START domain